MVTIAVDAEVFGHLQAHARPFLDSPNDVLHRLLLGKSAESVQRQENGPSLPDPVPNQPDSLLRGRDIQSPSNVETFVVALLKQEFGSEKFSTKNSYRLMFENADSLVYVQNYNKPSNHLWYRVTKKPWHTLQSAHKEGWICFTYPPDQIAYIIPVKAIIDRARVAFWSRDYLEVNIDPMRSRWIELDWTIESYKKRISAK